MERKAGLASITGGSLIGFLGSKNPSFSSMVIGLSTDPSSQGKRKLSTDGATYLESGVSVEFIPTSSVNSSINCNSPSWFSVGGTCNI